MTNMQKINADKIRVISDGLGNSVTICGWNTKNDKLREVAIKMVGTNGSVRVRYWYELNLISDVFYNTATGATEFGIYEET